MASQATVCHLVVIRWNVARWFIIFFWKNKKKNNNKKKYFFFILTCVCVRECVRVHVHVQNINYDARDCSVRCYAISCYVWGYYDNWSRATWPCIMHKISCMISLSLCIRSSCIMLLSSRLWCSYAYMYLDDFTSRDSIDELLPKTLQFVCRWCCPGRQPHQTPDVWRLRFWVGVWWFWWLPLVVRLNCVNCSTD